ncbi:MAG: zinc ABC transporter substrate-binding protein [Thiohalocapsa sp.]|nr:zinc ABC transporter substrate-binding protein [Thiohalocapsa sp.]MCF7988822.1 zinc ABC transporter substrate-binding protein [Thiohalocapsa sp.]
MSALFVLQTARRRLAAVTLLSLGLCGAPALAEPLSVFVSVLPLETFVEQVGGERVDVRVMVMPGQSPATYEPSPKQIAALAEADLYIRIGVPFEQAWMDRIRAANPDMPVLDLREGLPLRRLENHTHDEHGHEHGHEHAPDHAHEGAHDHAESEAADPMDPHIWTSPRMVRLMAESIRDALSRLDPAGTQAYAVNQSAFDERLQTLDAELAAMLSEIQDRSFLVYHPAWGYFADAYGLEQVPIELSGKEPGPRRLAQLVDQAKEAGARVILVQPQFDQRAAKQVARAIGGRVEAMNPLSADYAETLRALAALLVEAYAASGDAR